MKSHGAEGLVPNAGTVECTCLKKQADKTASCYTFVTWMDMWHTRKLGQFFLKKEILWQIHHRNPHYYSENRVRSRPPLICFYKTGKQVAQSFKSYLTVRTTCVSFSKRPSLFWFRSQRWLLLSMPRADSQEYFRVTFQNKCRIHKTSLMSFLSWK